MKRRLVNLIIATASFPVDTMLQSAGVSEWIRGIWIGITLACLINGLANSFADKEN